MMVVSIVVPVYRNASTIITLYSQVVDVFNRLQGIGLELCFVDDGSDDASLELIQQLAVKDSRVCYLSFDRNYGQVAAIIAGLRHCRGNSAVVMSADLQDPPEMILEMIRSWEEGSVITICYRKSRNDRFIDKLFSAAFYGIMKLIYPLIPKGGFDFFLLDRSALLAFNNIDNRGRFIQGDVVKLEMPIVFLPYERLARKAGKSQWTFKRKLHYAFDAIAYSRRALLLISLTGSAFFICCFLFFIEKREFSVVFLLLLFLGIILSTLGLVGLVYRALSNRDKLDQFYSIASKSIA